MARNILLARRDRARSGTYSGGSWAQPLTNLQDINPQKVAVATNTDAASTQFVLDLGAAYTIGLFYFANLNINSSASIRLRAGTDPDPSAANNYDTGTVGAWPSDDNGTYSSDEYDALGRPRAFIPSSPPSVRYILVEITSASFAPQLGVFCACEVVEPTINMRPGWNIAIIDESDVRRVPFGSVYVTSHTFRRRRVNFGFDLLPTAETFATLFSLAAAVGRSVPLVVAPDPEDTDNLERQAVYGMFSQEPQFANPFFGYFEHVYSVEQLI